jgi:hypothetical protein
MKNFERNNIVDKNINVREYKEIHKDTTNLSLLFHPAPGCDKCIAPSCSSHHYRIFAITSWFFSPMGCGLYLFLRLLRSHSPDPYLPGKDDLLDGTLGLVVLGLMIMIPSSFLSILSQGPFSRPLSHFFFPFLSSFLFLSFLRCQHFFFNFF